MTGTQKLIVYLIIIVIASALAAFAIYRITSAPIVDHYQEKYNILEESVKKEKQAREDFEKYIEERFQQHLSEVDDIKKNSKVTYENYNSNPDNFINDYLMYINK